MGSYPWPEWLHAHPTAEAIDDATRVVIHLQEKAGIDVVCEGEFVRFDPEPSPDQWHDRVFRASDGRRAGG